MNARHRASLLLAAALAVGVGLAGCGLKGALALPEKSGNVVIRSQSSSTAPGATTPPAEGSATPTTETKVPPAPEKLPPPELPHSNTGTPR